MNNEGGAATRNEITQNTTPFLSIASESVPIY